MQPPSPARAAWLLVGLRLQRWRNVTTRRRGTRQGTARKGRLGGLAGLGFGLGLLGVFTVITHRVLSNIIGDDLRATGATLTHDAALGCILQVCICLLAALLVEGGARQWSQQAEWDLEWLSSLPVPLSPLLAGRMIDRSITNFIGILTLWPLMSWLIWYTQATHWAPLLGMALTLPLLMIVGTCQTLIDTGLRLWLSAPQLRNMQAMMSLGGIVAIYASIAASAASYKLAQKIIGMAPEALFWTPAGLFVQGLADDEAGAVARHIGLGCLEIALWVVVSFVILRLWLRRGVASGGARETGGVRLRRPRRVGRWDLLGPIARRELLLLLRDRNYLVQTLLVPVIIMTCQLYLQANQEHHRVAVTQSPAIIASVAFGVAAHALMFSAFQTLIHEGQALWVLYCLPQDLQDILRRKALFWCAVVMFFPLAFLLVSLVAFEVKPLDIIGGCALALCGVPMFAVIATSLGVFGSNPLATEAQRRLKIGTMYQYLTLAGVYIYAIQSSNPWRRMTLIVLVGSLALALWQKARDRLPYLLDPVAVPERRVALADGLIAATIFVTLQDLIVNLWMHMQSPTPEAMLSSFVCSGAITWALMHVVYSRSQALGVPRVTLPSRLAAAVGQAGLAGVGAALAAMLYLQVMLDAPLFAEAMRANMVDPGVSGWLVLLAVVAAPVFEEFIFRGLVFGGMLPLLPAWAAGLLSASLFAFMHEPLAALPVFGLGLACAWVYHNTRTLLAPVLAHAIYNAAVLVWQWHLAEF